MFFVELEERVETGVRFASQGRGAMIISYAGAECCPGARAEGGGFNGDRKKSSWVNGKLKELLIESMLGPP